MGLALRTALLLLIYPILYVGVRLGWNRPQRFVTWGTASLIGLAVLIVLMTVLPAELDVLGLGSRISRPLCAYLGGLVVTATMVLLARLVARSRSPKEEAGRRAR